MVVRPHVARFVPVALLLLLAPHCSSDPPRPQAAQPSGGHPSTGGSPVPGVSGGASSGGTGSGSGSSTAGGTSGAPGVAGAGGSGGTEGGVDAGVDAADGGEGELVVTVKSGTLRGKLEAGTRRFLGIPFGAPTTGEHRFAPPVPASSWEGVREATEYGPRCMGIAAAKPPEGMSEDCLNLNVTAPRAPAAEAFPVMVFLFGGGFQLGSAAWESQWLSRRGAVVVTLNYRVGALGLMAHPAIDAGIGTTSGNMALRDQQLGLRWVKDNIAAFGGDPSRITLFGESAGALSTCVHLFARGSEDLASRFIMESGSCVAGQGKVRSRTELMKAGTQLADHLCPFATDVLACLRAQPAEAFTSLIAPGVVAASFWPYVDGELIPREPIELIEEGRFSRSPFIVGSNRDERRFFDLYGPRPVADRLTFSLNVALNYPADADAIAAHYVPRTDAEAYETYNRLWNDNYFRCPARALARAAAAKGRAAYLYSFDVAPAVHSQELDYVFDWPCCGVSSRYPDEAPNPLLREVVDAMQGYWVQFARTGDPNRTGLPEWERYSLASDPHMTFAGPVVAASGLSKEDCDFWDQRYALARTGGF